MPRVSAKRKARSEIGRENIKKRWKKDDVSQHVVAELPASPDPPPPPSSTSFLQPPTQSAATFRHNLIPQQYREVQEVSDTAKARKSQRVLAVKSTIFLDRAWCVLNESAIRFPCKLPILAPSANERAIN